MTNFKKHILNATKYAGGKPRPETSEDEFIKLSSNENPFGPSPKALEAIGRNLLGLSEYPDNDDTRLRHALVEYYSEKISIDHLFAAPSGSELIEIICRGFLEIGEKAIVCSPTFLPFRVFVEKCGGQIIDVSLEGEEFLFNPDQVLQSIDSYTKLIFLPTPNNPVGNYIPRRTMDYFIKNLPANVILVVDEVYRHFVDAPDYTTAFPYVLDGHRVIGLNSFSKVYGLAGLRLGYGYAQPEIAQYLRLLCKPFLNSSLAIYGGIAALSDREFVTQTVKSNRIEKHYLYREFDKFSLAYWKSQANFIMIKPPMEEELFEDLMLKENIMVRPVGASGAVGCVRVTIGRNDQNLKLVSALEKVLRKKVILSPV